jgi:Family of unknown function (DUF5719)
MKGRGQGALTVVVLAAVVAGAILAERVGIHPSADEIPAGPPSQAWICPHGGGTGWRGKLFVANPGEAASTVRVTTLGSRAPKAPQMVDVPASSEVAISIEPKRRGDATFIEAFGGWVAVGWVLRGGPGELGVGAEPCTQAAGRRWFLADGNTGQPEEVGPTENTYLVVANPFDADAVVDVTLFAAQRAPVRVSELTDLVVRGRRAIAISLTRFEPGEHVLGMEVRATAGRVAAATLGVSSEGAIRSVIGSTSLTGSAVLPVGGVGQWELTVLVPGDAGVGFSATLLSTDQTVPAGDLIDANQDAISARAYPIQTSGPSAVLFAVAGDEPAVAVTLRSMPGVGDAAATAGALAPSNDWVVLPAVAREPATPGLILVNSGNDDAEATLTLLGRPDAAGLPESIVVEIPAGRVAEVPVRFLAAAPGAAVLVRSNAPVVALAASASLELRGSSGYALSAGVPMP